MQTVALHQSLTNVVTVADTDASAFYEPTLTATLHYDCKKKQAFTAGDMKAHLGLKATDDARDEGIVEHMETDSLKALSRETNGFDFKATWQARFDLGANHPHSAYYAYDETCADPSQCKGKLTFTALSEGVDAPEPSDLITGGAGWNDAAVKSSALVLPTAPTAAAAACDGTDWDSDTASPGISEYKACGLVQSDVVLGGASGLLTDFSALSTVPTK